MINERLKYSLHQGIKIDLLMKNEHLQNSESKSDNLSFLSKFKRLWELTFTIHGREEKILMPDQKLIDIFNCEDVRKRLLILGELGSGKTTELLWLASELVEKAENDSNEPIPVIFDASTWKEDEDIEEWLVNQLEDKNKNIHIRQRLIRNKHLAVLIDGLNEDGIEHQTKCIETINQWNMNNRTTPLVICCRRDAYDLGNIQLDEFHKLDVKPLNRYKD